MKPVHAIVTAGALGALAVAAPYAFAQAHTHQQMSTAAAPAAHATAAAAGEVRNIDAAHGRLTVKHDASKEMNMPAMTMVYAVAQPALLTKVKVGDKVRFRIATIGGKMTITDLQAVH